MPHQPIKEGREALLQFRQTELPAASTSLTSKFFDEEVIKLDHWSDDLKKGLEREIKEIDKEIREARKIAALAASLSDKLKAQKQIKALELKRNKKRRELFDAQDNIDAQRDELIAKIEKQLKHRHSIEQVFTVRWSLLQ